MYRFPWCVIVFFLVLILLSQHALAAGWNTAGYGWARTNSTGEPLFYTLYRRWEHETGGTTFCQPVTDGSTLFIGTDEGDLIALDTLTGHRRWKFETDPRSRIRMTPAVDFGTVYFGTMDGTVYAVDVSSGALRWRFAGAGWINGSPVVANGFLYVSCYDGRIYSISLQGKEEWVHNTEGEFISSPLVLAGDVIIYGTMNGNVIALDAKTGAIRWKQATSGWVSGVAYDPARARLIVTSAGPKTGGIYSLRLSTGEVVWRYRSPGNNYWSAPALTDSSVWAGNLGSLVSVSLDTGSAEWIASVESVYVRIKGQKREFYPSVRTPVVGKAGGYVLCTFEVDAPARILHILDGGRVSGRWELTAVPSGPPIFSDGSLYFATTKGTVQAWTGLKVVTAGKSLEFGDLPPVIIEGSAFVPVRVFADGTGASVAWDPETRTATLQHGPMTVRLSPECSDVLVNGELRKCAPAPRIMNGRLYAPVRFLAENLLLMRVSWDPLTLTVILSQ